MKNLIKLIVILLVNILVFSSYSLADQQIIPLAKPTIDQEIKTEAARKKNIYPQKRPKSKQEKIEVEEQKISVEVTQKDEDIFIYPEKKPIIFKPKIEKAVVKSKILSKRDFKKAKVSQQDRDALQAMELNDEVNWEQIHSKFKELVKKYHPDKNQGNKKLEDKLKKITLAYSQLKKTLGKK